MKVLLLLLLFPALALASSDKIFDDYETYYASLPNRMFQGEAIKLSTFFLEGTRALTYRWEGLVDGHKHTILVRQGDDSDELFVDNHSFKSKQVKVVPGEEDSASIQLTGQAFDPVVYFASGWACLQWPEPMFARKFSLVYLVQLPKTSKKVKQRAPIWLLPGRFTSCAGIRMKSGQIKFDRIEFRSLKGHDGAVGVSFSEYTIKGGKFMRTNRPRRNATFVEPDDVYQFKFDK